MGALKTAEDKIDSEARAQGENDAAAVAENEVTRGRAEVEEIGNLTEQTPAALLSLNVSLNVDNLRLQDAGQGAQPLRLLKCGHVFHVSHSFTVERTLTIATTRKRAWTHGSSMCRAVVLCVNDLCGEASMKRRQLVQVKLHVHRVGDGSEEVGGEDRCECA